MVLRVAFQMDDISHIHPEKDSTFMIALEAQARGYEIYYYHPSTLALEDHHVTAHITAIQLQQNSKDHVIFLDKPARILLSEMDVIWVRQDPPFDMRYISTTYLLDLIKGNTFIVNNPTEIRNCPEKIFVHYFSEFMPPTLVSEHLPAIQDFYNTHQDIVIKPLYGCGGEGIIRFNGNSKTLASHVTQMVDTYQCPLVFQRTIPEVCDGDKRILLVDGKAVGAVLRVPPKGQLHANLHAGGTAVKTQLTDRDMDICQLIGPILRDRGLLFVGIDVIGDYITEINVTSPTGIQEVNRFDHTCVEALIWDAIEAKLPNDERIRYDV